MSLTLQILILVLVAAALAGVVFLLLRRPPPPDFTLLLQTLETLKAGLSHIEQASRDDLARHLGALRTELATQLALTREEQARSAVVTRDDTRVLFADFQKNTTAALTSIREAQSQQFADARHAQNQQLADTREAQNTRLNDFSNRLEKLQTLLATAAEDTRATLDSRLEKLAAQNAQKLDEMRQTVDEKLQSTLEKRLGESFKQVSERLESVHKSLGEMQAVATDVGDLKRVLTNVKTRGTWGEYQLGAILETMLLPEQYETNVKPNPRSESVVEFAVKLPGRDEAGKPVWLPIDAKFPKENYERLSAASLRADPVATEQAARDLAADVEKSARDIRDRYISPPHTTDFAVLFLPTEGLYAEIIRRPGVADKIQREYRVLLAGPSTLAALLNSLQMGFKTLAIQKRSSEVWKLLGAVKTQFGTFGELLAKVQKKLDEASKVVGDAAQRHGSITRRIAKVEEMPAAEAAELLPLEADQTAAKGGDSDLIPS
ncbi:DNA recombination protein RmuC [Geminisphaera colitermitum]|uniref:DNA recombination protein RmuC n=1 Tax=Geminisphaera colitermitum TaxID=1148786 RepID=UPI000158C959|nr:DNA recombination protein RmuC [Geminisphaera colitermitum]